MTTTMTTKNIAAMTPDQLLAHDSYAVVRFIDGELAWMVESFSSLEAAEGVAAQHRKGTKADYRVVRIEHAA